MKNKTTKRGYLTLELVIVIVIVASLIGVSLIAGNKVLKMTDVTRISKEYQAFSQAIIQFYQTKGRLPGNIPSMELSGNLYNTVLASNLSKVTDMTCGNETCQVPSNQITGIKSTIAFQQMAISNYIASNIISTTYQISSTNACLASATENFHNIREKLIPASKYSDQTSWLIGFDSSLNSQKLSPKNSIIYDSTIYPTFSNKPRLILFNSASYRGTSSTTCEIDVANNSSGFMGSGTIAADIAYDLDVKLDDSMPSSGYIVSENDTGTTNGKCTSTETNLQNRVYTNSTSDDGKIGCIMTFLVNFQP